MDWGWVDSLAGVVIGGAIAAWTGKAATDRAARDDALVAVERFRGLPFDSKLDNDAKWRSRLESRMALFRSGVPWIYVELIDRATQALIAAEHAIKPQPGDNPHRGTYASMMRHPSRVPTRPLVLYRDVVCETVAERIEQPIRGRLFSMLRQWQLRRALAAVYRDNEVRRMPETTGDFFTVAIQHRPVAEHLTWPSRGFTLLRPGRLVQPPPGFWPALTTIDTDAQQPRGGGEVDPSEAPEP
ncbi:hypothetical protein HNR19_000311 [Nocardioides thalensis]|uniref:Uncharacterized protein n=1 Tax=Nocardioides thalensis TaxID=1914755 RepID=A0A853BZQ1_9ACTN|nr:hypothetical protein [Nocardioides thalensis]NYI99612.1 hypothetical protein [Nocardioides thalensis]